MQSEEIEEIVEKGSDRMTARAVFGEPIHQNGITLISVAKVRGVGGGGSGEGPERQGKGWGAGFGMTSRALGMYVIKGEDVRFVPAVDVERIAAIFGFVAAVAIFSVVRPFAKAWAKRMKGSGEKK